jgi:Cu-Zn family superoxide dismutase
VKIRNPSLSLALAVGLGGCATPGDPPTLLVGKASLQTADGQPAGFVELNRIGERMRLSVSAIGLQPGPHGMHLHMTGKCEAPDFTSAGAHLNPGARQHGSANPSGSHLGDQPNLVAGSSGVGTLFAELPGMASEIVSLIFDDDGTALVIHAAPDDYRADPSGNSGARIACGVLVLAGS